MPYVDLNTIHNPATGTVAPATWGDQVRDNDEFMIDPPAVSVFHSVGQSVNSGTQAALAANSENFDNNGMHSTVTNNSRITFQTAGRYLILGTVEYPSSSTGWRSTGFYINGAFSGIGGQTVDATNGQVTRLTATRTVVASVGDFIEFQVHHTAGAALSVELLEFAAHYITR